MTPKKALSSAIKKAGGKTALAKMLGVSPQAVGQWKIAPPQHAIKIEIAVGAKITRHQLRPDLYPLSESQ